MKLLLDTHAFLWFIAGNKKLFRYARQLIEDPVNIRLLSTASLWEMSIKSSMGRLTLAMSFADLFAYHIRGNAIQLLTIKPAHLDILKALPFKHKDPFDRLLIAQAQCEGMSLLSKDKAIDEYGVLRLWSGVG